MTQEQLKKLKLPDTPGIYIFRDSRKKILYIGKATSLRDRVRSYFTSDLLKTRSPLIATMVARASSITWTETSSVLEALILEASLIKKHQPPANTDEKDNKSFNYLVVTREGFPRILIVRGRILHDTSIKKDFVVKTLFGPFPHGGQLRGALKIVRNIFPFRDTCVPAVALVKVGRSRSGRHQGGACLFAQSRQVERHAHLHRDAAQQFAILRGVGLFRSLPAEGDQPDERPWIAATREDRHEQRGVGGGQPRAIRRWYARHG